MTISRKFNPPLPNMCLNISGRPLLKVDHYKYLGVWISHDLLACGSLMTSHGQNTYRRNVQKCLQVGWYNLPTVLWPLVTRMFKTTLHLTCEIKKLEYAAPVWDPHQKTNSHKIEEVQKFALKMCTKLWNRDYDSLLRKKIT